MGPTGTFSCVYSRAQLLISGPQCNVIDVKPLWLPASKQYLWWLQGLSSIWRDLWVPCWVTRRKTLVDNTSCACPTETWLPGCSNLVEITVQADVLQMFSNWTHLREATLSYSQIYVMCDSEMVEQPSIGCTFLISTLFAEKGDQWKHTPPKQEFNFKHMCVNKGSGLTWFLLVWSRNTQDTHQENKANVVCQDVCFWQKATIKVPQYPTSNSSFGEKSTSPVKCIFCGTGTGAGRSNQTFW